MAGIKLTGEDGNPYTLKVYVDGDGEPYPQIDLAAPEEPAPTADTVRTISNAEAPLLSLGDDVFVTFTLIDAGGWTVATAYDTTAEAWVQGGSVTAALSAAGVFSVSLWPTDRAAETLYYRCRITRGGVDLVQSVTRPLPEGDGSDMTFTAWKAQERW